MGLENPVPKTEYFERGSQPSEKCSLIRQVRARGGGSHRLGALLIYHIGGGAVRTRSVPRTREGSLDLITTPA